MNSAIERSLELLGVGAVRKRRECYKKRESFGPGISLIDDQGGRNKKNLIYMCGFLKAGVAEDEMPSERKSFKLGQSVTL